MYIINLDSVDAATPGVGAKAASLGSLSKAGFVIPRGFVVTSEAFEKFLMDTGISRQLPETLRLVDLENPATAYQAFRDIRGMFSRVSGNDFLIRDIRAAYDELCFGKDVKTVGGVALDLIKSGRQENFVSVRPSVACSQDGVSFPGHGKASLNLIGYKQIVAAVKGCWLSVFSPESIIYRKTHGIDSFSLAVIVQKMVDSELSGVLFTSDPVSGDRSKMLVEGFWGLGETLSAGSVCPDQFLIDKSAGTGTRRIGKKIWLRRRGPLSGTTIQERVPLSRVTMETLSDKDLARFLSIANRAEEIMKAPQEIEWCVERGRIVLLQARILPQKTGPEAVSASEPPASPPAPDFRGVGVSAGKASGKAVILKEGDPSAMYSVSRPQEPSVLVVRNLSMEILPYVRWFSGVVAEQGGCGSCMASLGRELGIPMVTGIENAAILLAGKAITLDGGSGSIYVSQPQK